MVHILIDGKQTQLLKPITALTSLEIMVYPMPRMSIPTEMTKPVAAWVYDLSQRAHSLMYNNVIIEKESVTELFVSKKNKGPR